MRKIPDDASKHHPKARPPAAPELPPFDPNAYPDLEERYTGRSALALVTPDWEDTQPEAWESLLRVTTNRETGERRLTKDPGNAAVILANHELWRGLRFDTFSGRVIARDLPPLDGMPSPSTPEGLELYVAHWFALRWKVTFPAETIRSAIHVAAQERRHHAVWDWLDGLTWDGTFRIDQWVTTYLGAEDNQTTRAIGRMWLVSAVARAHKPGAKVDHMLVLEGDQGARKTTALEALCSAEWFQPELGDLRNKDALVTLRGKWVVCMDELHSLRSADVTELAKNYLTRTVDKYRPPYGRHEVEQPRSCVFAGTTNADTYLADPTGNRRFWPVRVGSVHPVDLEGIKRDRAQIWAEAKEAYLGGTQWWPDAETQSALNEATENRTHGDTWAEIIAADIEGREYTTIQACLEKVGVMAKDMKHAEQMRVAKLLGKLGWERYRAKEGGRLVWRYRMKGQL